MLKLTVTVLCVVLFAGLFAAAQATESPWAGVNPNTGGAGLTAPGGINPQTQVTITLDGRMQELIEQFIAEMVARGFLHAAYAGRATAELNGIAAQVGGGALGLGVVSGDREPER